MLDQQLDDAEVAALADRLAIFMQSLSSREQAFLVSILASMPQRECASGQSNREVHDLVRAIDQSYFVLSEDITLNPQPIPRSFRLPQNDAGYGS